MLVMKRFIVYALSVVLTLTMTACAGKSDLDGIATVGTEPHDDSMVRDETLQIPNPWQECETLADAEKLVGFSFTAPETVEGFPERYISAMEYDIAQVIFRNEASSLCFRKGLGSEDVSGDYTAYTLTETRDIGGKTVVCRGNDGLVYTAAWTDGTYAYAVTLDTGMTAQQLEQWVQSLS